MPVRVARRAVRLAAAGGLAATVFVWLGGFFWLTELATHFRLQLVLGCGLAAIAALAVRAFGTAVLLAGLSVLHVLPMLAYLWPSAVAGGTAPASFRIVSANVSMRNDDHAALQAFVIDARPDVVGLLEASEAWVRALDPVADEYPYVISHPQDGPFGLLLMSRFPLRELPASPYRDEGIQGAILAETDIAGHAVTLVLAHVRSPITPAEAAGRNRQLEALADFLRDDGNPDRVLIGDLNTTPWSPRYGAVEEGTGLRNAARGRGYLWTWPVGLPVLGIPIDHCLLSGGLEVERIHTGPDIGSDHLPLVVDLGFATEAGADGRARPGKDEDGT